MMNGIVKVSFYGNEFRWSASYNETDWKQPGNTMLLLNHEITE